MTAVELGTLIGLITTSMLSIIAAIFAGLAALRGGTNATRIDAVKTEVQTVTKAVSDPITGLKPLHDLSNSNFSKLAEDRDKEREGRTALSAEVARLNQAATDLAAATHAENIARQLPPTVSNEPLPVVVVGPTPIPVEITDPNKETS